MIRRYLAKEFTTDAGLAANYDELTFWASYFGQLLMENIPIRAGAAVLDVGCATGFPLMELANAFGPDSRITGIDLWSEAIAKAKQKIEFFGLHNVEVRTADGAAMPFDDASFDLVVSNLGLNNFDNPTAVLNECARVCRPGGTMAMTTNVTGNFAEVYEELRESVRVVAAERVGVVDEDERKRGTAATVRTLVEAASFRVTRVVEERFAFRFANAAALLDSRLVFWFLGGWRRAARNAEEERAIFAELEKRLDEIARTRGEIRASVPMVYVEAVREFASARMRE